ncbi:myb-like protein X [Vespula maculifrons]|uniref:Myb-like protein X n=1 Tax=Vespula maculifrons TaxID=7453 RepID=A0ABD2B995_VESMC
MAVTTNFNETNMALFTKINSEIRNDKKNLKEINDDFKRKSLKKRREEEGEEEEEDGEEVEEKEKKEEEKVEEKEKEEEAKEEEVQDKDKDYKPTLVYDSIDDRFYLDNNDSKDKFNSNQNDVDV